MNEIILHLNESSTAIYRQLMENKEVFHLW